MGIVFGNGVFKLGDRNVTQKVNKNYQRILLFNGFFIENGKPYKFKIYINQEMQICIKDLELTKQ